MKDALEYLRWVKALIIVNPQVVHWQARREEAQGNVGLFRYRLQLQDGGLLEAFEVFQINAGNVEVTKYSFHWQDAEGRLVKRWDNAAHHPEVETYPSHVHLGSENMVQPCEPIDMKGVLDTLVTDQNQG